MGQGRASGRPDPSPPAPTPLSPKVPRDLAAPPASVDERRVRALLRGAQRVRAGVPLDRLLLLLPTGTALSSDGELRRWMAERPTLASVEGDVAFVPGSPPEQAEPRQERGRRCLEEARALLDGPLARLHPWVLAAAVTGSVAYGVPEEGDDVDLFLLVRRGALWLVLAGVFSQLRHRAPRGLTWCFNFALEEGAARELFRRPHGLLWAREALEAVALHGELRYRALLEQGDWMEREIPRLYRARVGSPAPSEPLPPAPPAPLGWRCLNALLFPPMAAYLQLVGIFRNHRLMRQGRGEEAFRTLTAHGQLSLRSRKFDELTALSTEDPSATALAPPRGLRSRSAGAAVHA